MQKRLKMLEHCLKCSHCQSACPIANQDPGYPGPKILGPDLFRLQAAGAGVPSYREQIEKCCGCQSCERACPYGVPITGLIRANKSARSEKTSLRDKLLASPDLMGGMGGAFAPLANRLLQTDIIKKSMRGLFDLELEQPLTFAPREKLLPAAPQKGDRERKVLYFPGCRVAYNEPEVGKDFLHILEMLGVEVTISQQFCCGMPLLASPDPAQSHAKLERNLRYFTDFISKGYDIITSCPSCSLAFKKIYVEELANPQAERFAAEIYDFSEFLLEHYPTPLKTLLQPITEQGLVYHLPCHSQAQGTAMLGLDLLRLIPGLEELETVDGCCGQSGTYAYKVENKDVSQAVGKALAAQLTALSPPLILTPCGSCKDRISFLTDIKTIHPVQLLKKAMETSLSL